MNTTPTPDAAVSRCCEATVDYTPFPSFRPPPPSRAQASELPWNRPKIPGMPGQPRGRNYRQNLTPCPPELDPRNPDTPAPPPWRCQGRLIINLDTLEPVIDRYCTLQGRHTVEGRNFCGNHAPRARKVYDEIAHEKELREDPAYMLDRESFALMWEAVVSLVEALREGDAPLIAELAPLAQPWLDEVVWRYDRVYRFGAA